jgi:hypothetical protein
VEGIAGGEVARQRSHAGEVRVNREGNAIGWSSGGSDERGALQEERVGCGSVGGWARRVPQGG